MEKVVNYQNLSTAYKGKRVFVTGHTGFKGSWLVAWLHQLGAIVKGYALAPDNKECLFNLLEPLNMVESVIADIRQKEKLKEEIVSFKPDFIFHLAAQALVRRSYLVPSETFEINAIGTANLLEVAHKMQCKCTIVVITTDKVYENKEQDVLYQEDDRLGGHDPYSASKACTELVVTSFRKAFFYADNLLENKVWVATARAGNVIGGGDYSEDRIIPDLVRALQHNKIIELRNPSSIRPWQHVLEPLGAYLLLGSLLDVHKEKYSEAYNFGPHPSDHLKVFELVDLAIKTWGRGEWIDTGNAGQPHEAALLKLDITKANDHLHWAPKLTASEAIEWTMQWYRKDRAEALPFTFEQIKNYMQL